MDSPLWRWLEQGLGVLVTGAVLLDVFMVVLYSRAGTGLLAPRLAQMVWRTFRALSRRFSDHRGGILSFCGPAILSLLILLWGVGLTLGAGLIIHPLLGTSVSASGDETPRDFVTALYAGGSSVAIIGASDFTPQTTGTRLLYGFNSLVGMSIVSLTLSYLLQVYTALQRRNALGLSIHLSAGPNGDAAHMVATWGPRGEFMAGYADVSAFATLMTDVSESHHFYPVLHFFRFREPYYSVSTFALTLLDATSLVKSALSDEGPGWFKESAAIEHLEGASLWLLRTLENTYHQDGTPDDQREPSEKDRARWGRRYEAALQRLQGAGILTAEDEAAGLERYIALRSEWDGDIARLAPDMELDMDEVDAVGSRL